MNLIGSITDDRAPLAYEPRTGGMLDFGRRLVGEAGQALGLSDTEVVRLAEPQRLIEVALPDPRDGGGIIRAFRSQHSNRLGPSKGGVRMSESVTRAEVEALSLFMTLKTSTVDLPLGGGKGGIVVDPTTLTDDQRMEVTEAFARRLVDVIGPEIDVLGPDVGTGADEMDAMHRAWQAASGRTGSPATGKSVDSGGLAYRTGATANGLDIVFASFAERLGLGDSLRFSVHGFGSVGKELARRLTARGHVLVAAGDSGGAAVDSGGLDLEELVDRKSETGSVGDGKHESAEVLIAECDVVIPAALQGVIDHQVASQMQAALVLEGANGPCTWEGNATLRQRGISVIPDILANAGGVSASFEEMTPPDERDDESVIDDRFTDRMETAGHRVWEIAAERDVDLRTAATIVALERLL